MAMSVDYQWVTSASIPPGARTVWEIRSRGGSVVSLGVDLGNMSGTLQAFVPLRPEEEPFECRVALFTGVRQPTRPLSEWTAMR